MLLLIALAQSGIVLDTEKILIGIIIGLIAVIFSMVTSRISTLEKFQVQTMQTITEIKGIVVEIKANCPNCEGD